MGIYSLLIYIPAHVNVCILFVGQQLQSRVYIT